MGKEEYKEKIIEMIKSIENIYFLRAIYVFLEKLKD